VLTANYAPERASPSHYSYLSEFFLIDNTYDFFSCHIDYDTALRIPRASKQFVALFREPIERLISQYRFWRSHPVGSSSEEYDPSLAPENRPSYGMFERFLAPEIPGQTRQLGFEVDRAGARRRRARGRQDFRLRFPPLGDSTRLHHALVEFGETGECPVPARAGRVMGAHSSKNAALVALPIALAQRALVELAGTMAG